MLELLDQWDQQLFLLINGLHHPWIDPIMLAITSRYHPIPIYILAIGFMLWKYKWKGLWLLITVISTILIANHITAEMMKPFFERFRPCRNLNIKEQIHLLIKCKGTYGMASSHASSSVAMITTLWLLFKNRVNWIRYLYIWVLLVIYSRIYVGVHYPGDVIIGSLVGLAVSFGLVFLYRRLDQKYAISIDHSKH